MAAAISKLDDYRNRFAASFANKTAIPSTAWSTVHCWVEPSLIQVIGEVRTELAAEGWKADRLTHHSLLQWLQKIGLLHPVNAEGETFYLLELGADAARDVDPLELLLAKKPDGVICYFSAVAFHSLTTQPVGFHHIAHLQAVGATTSRGQREVPTAAVTEDTEQPQRGKMPVLGSLLCRFRDMPFYATRRSVRLVPGVHTRAHGPRTTLRITTLEQTLLDTLLKPFHCGGPEVVFEAWHEAVEGRRFDEERLTEYLTRMQYPAVTRRLAVMLDLLSHAPGPQLRQHLEECRQTIDRSSPLARIPLLTGVSYENLNEAWLVYTP